MNSIIEKQYPIFELYQGMRRELMESLSDEDLAFTPENCPSLGALCLQIGEWQQAYIDGFKTFKQDFSYRHPQPEAMQASVEQLQGWYAELDAELRAAVEALSAEQVAEQTIDRGGWEAALPWSLDIYKECLVIFYSKAWVYIQLMGKPLPESLEQWLS